MAMHADDRLLDIRHARAQRGDQLKILVRRGVADGIRNIHRAGAGGDDRLDDFTEKIHLRARGVFGGKFHVVAERSRQLHGFDRHRQHFLARLSQLILHVDVGGGDEGVNALALRGRHRFGHRHDVLLVRAAEPGDSRPLHFLGNAVDRLEIALGRDGKTRFNDIYAQARELAGDFQLLLDIHAGTGRLLAVAQRGVEYDNLLRHGAILGLLARGREQVVPLYRRQVAGDRGIIQYGQHPLAQFGGRLVAPLQQVGEVPGAAREAAREFRLAQVAAGKGGQQPFPPDKHECHIPLLSAKLRCKYRCRMIL
ncbi:MAG: hypothetical protein BWY76_01971 [bacterium ADurb.Bin429]|nr:MAG: hypothetical protein BWY76_01971 [bacterium ADurb.Bin429]